MEEVKATPIRERDVISLIDDGSPTLPPGKCSPTDWLSPLEPKLGHISMGNPSKKVAGPHEEDAKLDRMMKVLKGSKITLEMARRIQRMNDDNICANSISKAMSLSVEEVEAVLWDPAPKRNAFQVFCQDRREADPGRYQGLPVAQAMATLAPSWSLLGESDRAWYQSRADSINADKTPCMERWQAFFSKWTKTLESRARKAKGGNEKEGGEVSRLRGITSEEMERRRSDRLKEAEASKQAKVEAATRKRERDAQLAAGQLAGVDNRYVQNQSMRAEVEAANPQRAAFFSRHWDVIKPFLAPANRDKKSPFAAKVLAGAEQASKAPPAVDPSTLGQPKSIVNGDMYPYQIEGLRWMVQQHQNGVGGIVGDEMGLGKTLQVISFLAHLREHGEEGPHLITCPLSVLPTWASELTRWCPHLRVVVFHGSDRKREELRKQQMSPGQFDVVVTTYEMVVADSHTLNRFVYRYLVIDEAQRIKNDASQAFRAVRRIKAVGRLLLTGTPLQNNVHELWALLNCLFPELFTDSSMFDAAFSASISVGAAGRAVDFSLLNAAHRLLQPLMLRRLKRDVHMNLPPKTVCAVFLPLSAMQKFWYKRILMGSGETASLLGNASLPSGVAAQDNRWRKLCMMFMQLRKVCAHPFLFPGSEPEDGVTDYSIVKASAKMRVLHRLLARLKEEGHRVLIYSQFTSVLDIIEDYVNWVGYRYLRLDGSTRLARRGYEIALFNHKKSDHFCYLLTTRAGGLGISLTGADTVIMFDSDCIGQTKPTRVYQFVTKESVEERMYQRAQQKLCMNELVLRDATGKRRGQAGGGSLMDYKDDNEADAVENISGQELWAFLRCGAREVLTSADTAPDADLTDEQVDAILEEATRPLEQARTDQLEDEHEASEEGVEGEPTTAAQGGEDTKPASHSGSSPPSFDALKESEGEEAPGAKRRKVAAGTENDPVVVGAEGAAVGGMREAVGAGQAKPQADGEAAGKVHPQDAALKSRLEDDPLQRQLWDSRTFEGESYKAATTYRSIADEWAEMVGHTRRPTIPTVIPVGRQNVLKWTLEANNGSSLTPAMTQRQREYLEAQEERKKNRQVNHDDHCLHCARPADVATCGPLVPCGARSCHRVLHQACMGDQARRGKFVICPQHHCSKCGGSGSHVGGLLFRCVACPETLCFRCMPGDFEAIDRRIVTTMTHYVPGCYEYFKCTSCAKATSHPRVALFLPPESNPSPENFREEEAEALLRHIILRHLSTRAVSPPTSPVTAAAPAGPTQAANQRTLTCSAATDGNSNQASNGAANGASHNGASPWASLPGRPLGVHISGSGKYVRDPTVMYHGVREPSHGSSAHHSSGISSHSGAHQYPSVYSNAGIHPASAATNAAFGTINHSGIHADTPGANHNSAVGAARSHFSARRLLEELNHADPTWSDGVLAATWQRLETTSMAALESALHRLTQESPLPLLESHLVRNKFGHTHRRYSWTQRGRKHYRNGQGMPPGTGAVLYPVPESCRAPLGGRRDAFRYLQGFILNPAVLPVYQPGPKESDEPWCAICQDGGDLLCCSACPRVYHLGCVHLVAEPEGDWACGSHWCRSCFRADCVASDAPHAWPGVGEVKKGAAVAAGMGASSGSSAVASKPSEKNPLSSTTGKETCLFSSCKEGASSSLSKGAAVSGSAPSSSSPSSSGPSTPSTSSLSCVPSSASSCMLTCVGCEGSYCNDAHVPSASWRELPDSTKRPRWVAPHALPIVCDEACEEKWQQRRAVLKGEYRM
eukprot:jgi/Mesvir1/27270/Mv07105-RA.2